MSLILLAFACTDPPKSTTSTPFTNPTVTDPTGTTPTDVTTTTTTTTSLPTGLFGTEPPVTLPPPVFTALNMDGSARTQPDLIGMPTVLWFYPAAFTGG